ncbi:MAG: 16S rRNA (guanine(966)-N(2))-methyltransferase RsmD [Candidatus Acidiferrales bacterium]
MRIIAGKFGSRRLKGPGKLRLRPTSDRLRETIFNILGPTIEGSLFLDVYAGSGAIGLEALSRGAREVVFIEKHAGAVTLLHANLEQLGVRSGVEVLGLDALRGLEILARRHYLADLIFLDPPYEMENEYERCLDFFDGPHLIAPSGMLIVEHSRRQEMPQRLVHLERIRVAEQGDATLSFYRLSLAA